MQDVNVPQYIYIFFYFTSDGFIIYALRTERKKLFFLLPQAFYFVELASTVKRTPLNSNVSINQYFI